MSELRTKGAMVRNEPSRRAARAWSLRGGCGRQHRSSTTNRIVLSSSIPLVADSKEMWYKSTIYAIGGIVIPFTLFTLYKEATHHHHEHGTVYPHMHVRAKAFPWGENQCDLFDLECKKAWRESHKKH
jgi:hypothetical protein